MADLHIAQRLYVDHCHAAFQLGRRGFAKAATAARADAQKHARTIDAACADLSFAERVLATNGTADLVARGWDVAALKICAAHAAVRDGRMTWRMASIHIDTPIADLPGLFAQHGLDPMANDCPAEPA